MSLSEVFNTPESVVDGAIMFVDMTDSTSMKEQESEATWLTTYAWFFDLLNTRIRELNGTIVKYLGDGAMAYFENGNIAGAINAAIFIQEDLKMADRHKKVFVSCSIGISAGKFKRFETSCGGLDYIGSVVDKAARLCSAASPMAIFVDRATINSAMMNNVKSKLGDLLDRSVDDYTGDQQKISLKGFTQPVSYHEIKWDNNLFGIKSQVITNNTKIVDQAAKTIPQTSGTTTEIRTGFVNAWNNVKHFGFIVSDNPTQESFYTNPSYTVGEVELSINTPVLFIASNPIGSSKNRLASTVVILGERYRGTITRHTAKDLQNQIATTTIRSSESNRMDFFTYLGSNPENIKIGDSIEFIVGINKQGPTATLIRNF